MAHNDQMSVEEEEEYIFYYDDKYLYNEKWYHISFPTDWAKSHEESTGPTMCENCDHFGSIEGIFLGYCANCANYIYNGERGRGFIDVGQESTDENVLCFDSIFDTYLKDVDINQILSIDDTIIHTNYNSDDEYVNDNDMGNSIIDCHFENGYNDF